MKVKYQTVGDRVEIEFGAEHHGKIISTDGGRLFLSIVNIEGKVNMMGNIFRRFRDNMLIEEEVIEFYS